MNHPSNSREQRDFEPEMLRLIEEGYPKWTCVMAGIVPAIHVFESAVLVVRGCPDQVRP